MKKEETKIAVKKILITMGKHEVGLTLEEARELQRMLNDMFKGPSTETVKHVHHYDYWKTWQPNYWTGTGIIGGAINQASYSTDNAKLQTLYQDKCNALEVKAIGWAGNV